MQIKPEIHKLLQLMLNLDRRLQNQTLQGKFTELYPRINPKNTTKQHTSAELTVNENLTQPPETLGTNSKSPNGDIELNVDEDLRRSVLKVFGSKPATLSVQAKPKLTTNKPPCGLIDVRGDIPDNCEELMSSYQNQKLGKTQKKRKRPPKLDVRSGGDDTTEESETDEVDMEENEENMILTTDDTTTYKNIYENITEESNNSKNFLEI